MRGTASTGPRMARRCILGTGVTGRGQSVGVSGWRRTSCIVEFVGCWRYFWERYWIKGARDQRDKLGFDQLNEQGLGRRLNNVDLRHEVGSAWECVIYKVVQVRF